jgi:hypothetical protein
MWAFHRPISFTSGPVRPPCSFSTLQQRGPFTDPSRARALPSVRLCLPVRHRRPAPATTSTTADRSSPPTRRRTRGRGRTTHRGARGGRRPHPYSYPELGAARIWGPAREGRGGAEGRRGADLEEAAGADDEEGAAAPDLGEAAGVDDEETRRAGRATTRRPAARLAFRRRRTGRGPPWRLEPSHCGLTAMAPGAIPPRGGRGGRGREEMTRVSGGGF